MDSELHTILEDNSVYEVSSVIHNLFSLFQSGRHEELAGELSKLPHCDLWLDVTYNVPNRHVEDSSSNESENEDGEKNESQPMDCEWTEVSYRKKR